MPRRERRPVSIADYTAEQEGSTLPSQSPIIASQAAAGPPKVQLNVRVPRDVRTGVNRAAREIEGMLEEEGIEYSIRPQHVVEAALEPLLADFRENGPESELAKAVRRRVLDNTMG